MRADAILQNTRIPTDLDWLVLPELAFTGYNFHSLEEIRPYLEPTTAGVSTQWAIAVSTHYKCHVTVGYPEVTAATPSKPSTQYNSTVTVSPTGKVLLNYHKSFLYYTDESWSKEGPDTNGHILGNPSSTDQPFYSGPLGGLGNVTMGICMDINPYRFVADWNNFEFARTALTHDTPLICVSMAWLSNLSPTELAQNPEQPDIATVAYWVERFQLLVETKSEKPVYIVLANRCGMEKTVCYAGSSTVIKIQSGIVSLFETCGKSEEKCLIVDWSETPKFQVRSGR